jgi:hypothetical protein
MSDFMDSGTKTSSLFSFKDGFSLHLSSHFIAIAALVIACFAVTGYISFRTNSIPDNALSGSRGTEPVHVAIKQNPTSTTHDRAVYKIRQPKNTKLHEIKMTHIKTSQTGGDSTIKVGTSPDHTDAASGNIVGEVTMQAETHTAGSSTIKVSGAAADSIPADGAISDTYTNKDRDVFVHTEFSNVTDPGSMVLNAHMNEIKTAMDPSGVPKVDKPMTTTEIDNYTPPHECIGSETIMLTDRGNLKLSDIKVGDKILSYDRTTKQSRMSTVHWIRVHDMSNHYRITTSSDTFNLTRDHLVLLDTHEYIPTEHLRIGDKLLSCRGVSEIMNIELINDIAMSPVVIDGTVTMPNGTVISCWSHNKENADKMDKLMKLIELHKDRYTLSELEELIERFYLTFLQTHKNMDKVNNILQNIGVPVVSK